VQAEPGAAEAGGGVIGRLEDAWTQARHDPLGEQDVQPLDEQQQEHPS